MNNLDFLNAMRAVASAEYNERIPTATQSNLKDIYTSILTYSATKNEFVETLLNKVVRTLINSKYYENPFKFFKKGELPFGMTLESVFADIIKAKDFSDNGGSEATGLLAVEKPNIKVEYYSQNYRHKYKISISDERLKSAFMSADGLQTMTNAIVTSALTSAENDEYLLMKSVLCGENMVEATITGFKDLTNDNDRSKELTKQCKTMINKFRFLSDQYNKQGVHTFSLPQDCVVIVTPETKAMIDVELLATAFHLDKAEMEGRLVMIDNFYKINKSTTQAEADDTTLAIVCDKDFVQFYDSLNHSESFRNPDNLTTNMFFHRWGVVACCGFANAVRLKTDVNLD